jgi:recombination protein RecT
MSKALTVMDEVRGSISQMAPQFKAALPPQVSPEKFMRVVLTAIQQSPGLLDCDRKSLYGAAMKAAQDGLLPDGREAAFVKFKDQVVYMPMVGGILKKVRNSGELLSITSQIVYEKDKFKYYIDLDGEHLEHHPDLFGDRGNPVGVYAIAKTKDGGVYIEVMTYDQIEDVRKASRAKDTGPWNSDFASEMWRKTVIRRLAKRLPMSTDLEGVIKRDDELYDVSPQVTLPPPQDKPKQSRLKKLMPKTETVSQIEAPLPDSKQEELSDDIPL